MVRRLLIATLLCALAGAFGAAQAHATFPAPPPLQRPALPGLVKTTHFAIHFNSDPTNSANYTSATKAGDFGANLERAYNLITSLGWQAPVDDTADTPGLLDVYLVSLLQNHVQSWAYPDGVTAPSSVSVDFEVAELDAADTFRAAANVAAQFFEGRWWLPQVGDDWAWYTSAEWLAAKVTGYGLVDTTDLGPPNVSLDCSDVNLTNQMTCSTIELEDKGDTRWSFFELLAQKFGPTFAISLYQQQNSSGGTMIDALQTLLAAKGTTLDDLFHEWSVRQIAGGWDIPGLDTAKPTPIGTFATGVDSGAIAAQTFSVDHLADRFVTFTRGDGAGDHACFAATLTISVTMPSGLNTRPVFYWNGTGSAPVELSVSGGTATATVPWDTCFWAANKAYLSLVNPSVTLNSALYTVSASLTVDTNTPATATKPPDPQTGATVYGGVTPVESAAVPPAITLLAPQTIKLTAANPTIKLVAQSNGDGSLHATLGSVDLGTKSVRAGSNALFFTVPKSLLSTLRRTAAAGGVLTLTPLSPSGTVAGTPMTRQVVIQAAAKPAAKPKAKAKAAKAKAKPKAKKHKKSS